MYFKNYFQSELRKLRTTNLIIYFLAIVLLNILMLVDLKNGLQFSYEYKDEAICNLSEYCLMKSTVFESYCLKAFILLCISDTIAVDKNQWQNFNLQLINKFYYFFSKFLMCLLIIILFQFLFSLPIQYKAKFLYENFIWPHSIFSEIQYWTSIITETIIFSTISFLLLFFFKRNTLIFVLIIPPLFLIKGAPLNIGKKNVTMLNETCKKNNTK